MGQLGTAANVVAALAAWKRYSALSKGVDEQRSHYDHGFRLGYSEIDPGAAEPYLRHAMGGPDPETAIQAARTAVDLFARAGDHPTARQYIDFMEQVAQHHGYSARLAPEIRQLMEREERAFETATFTEGRRGRTLAPPPADRDPHSGITHNQLMSAAGQMHGSKDPRERATFDRLFRDNPDVEASVTGRLVEDRRGRLGVEDLTTGRITLLDVPRGMTQQDGRPVADDVGKIVRCEGTSPLWSEGARMHVRGFGQAPNAQAARAGFRIEDSAIVRATSPVLQRQQQRVI